ncbi:MAG: hypothetical protein B7X79_15005 [Acidovorax sp. 17-64-282]|nr:MAG: hypothetical protein B7Y64_01690 [Acidovorax sp. 35-64-16]OYY83472.1 MAG: hypothetical protein B7Y46_15320 [Acidovorax sp. 28-64-14]OYZ44027.1 MAG: hypothetical protein B7Y20_12985 [Acidovorax sp. 16-64-162]OYZ67567.1 MAG: hypothetical protein B7Y14_14375 [Acidovorax sp. 24-64-9]OZA55412.1 MAG: hypothetical protein B7X79_15005 [Acidovorax sp. 17-64-282]
MKSEACFRQRGFDFVYAARAFFDPDRLVQADPRGLENRGQILINFVTLQLSPWEASSGAVPQQHSKLHTQGHWSFVFEWAWVRHKMTKTDITKGSHHVAEHLTACRA